MKKIIVTFFALLLTGCMLRPVYVPPNAYSLTSALRSVQDGYTLIFSEEIDGYGTVRQKGVVASYLKDGASYLFYGFKFYNGSAKDSWKEIVKNFGIWSSRTYLDFPTSGLYSTKKDGKYIVAWWKDIWLFVVESSSNAEVFANYAMDNFARIGGLRRW
ncbi:MAG TPA: DUF3242 domain-containing protein [Pseudothermotoga sp.]